MRHLCNIFSVLLISIFIVSCAGESEQEIKKFISQVKSSPAEKVTPLKALEPYNPEEYVALPTDSPFATINLSVAELIDSKPKEDTIIPDRKREREYLETFNLSELKMVGSFKRGPSYWALIEDKNGMIHSVQKGDYLGKNSGNIVSIEKNKIILQELIRSKSGSWDRRKTELEISMQGR